MYKRILHFLVLAILLSMFGTVKTVNSQTDTVTMNSWLPIRANLENTSSIQTQEAFGDVKVVNYRLYEESNSAKSGDFNNDGLLDVATVTVTNRLRIWLQNPTCHALEEKYDLPTVPYARYSAVADVNRDSLQDIIVFGEANPELGKSFGKSKIAIHYQTAAGFTSDYAIIMLDVHGTQFTVGDMNADGRLDIVFSKEVNFDLLIQQDDGSFVTAIGDHTPYSDTNAYSILDLAIADLNNDQRNDIVVQRYGAAMMSPTFIYIQNQAGKFILDQALSQSLIWTNRSTGGRGILTDDVNGDRLADLITVNSADLGRGNIAIHLQKASGGFIPITLAAYWYSEHPEIADMNRDGLMDIVAINNYDSTYSVHTQNPDHSFNNYTLYPSGGGLQVIETIDIADVNADQIPEVLFASREYGLHVAYHGTPPSCPPSGSYSEPAQNVGFMAGIVPIYALNEDTVTSSSSMEAVDLDQDGDQELVILLHSINPFNYIIRVVEQNSDGSFSYDKVIYTQALNPTWNNLAVADLNNDNYPDLVLTGWGGGRTLIQGPVGSFTIGSTYEDPILFKYGAGEPLIADWTGDGLVDILVGTTNRISILEQQQDGTLIMYYSQQVKDVLMDAVDWNHDGKLDLVGVMAGYEKNVNIYYQQEDVSFDLDNSTDYPQFTKFTIGDTNSDGLEDIILLRNLGYPNSSLGVFQQKSDHTLTDRLLLPDLALSDGLTVADFNHDGRNDIFTMGAFIGIYLQNSQNTFDPPDIYDMPYPESRFCDIESLDTDHDQQPDIWAVTINQAVLLLRPYPVTEIYHPIVRRN